jgi:hypothetical protein
MLKAYASSHVSEIMDAGKTEEVWLIDLSASGARLKLKKGDAESRFKRNHDLLINIRPKQSELQAGFLPCQVSWTRGDELGIDFYKRLPFSTQELQDLIG